jgi:hypothetical protein
MRWGGQPWCESQTALAKATGKFLVRDKTNQVLGEHLHTAYWKEPRVVRPELGPMSGNVARDDGATTGKGFRHY